MVRRAFRPGVVRPGSGRQGCAPSLETECPAPSPPAPSKTLRHPDPVTRSRVAPRQGLSWESHQRSHKVTWLRPSTAPSPGSHVTGATWRWRRTAACLRRSRRHRRRDLELGGHNGYLTFVLLLGRGLMAQAENLV